VKILLHGINFAPELVGTGKYTGEMAEWLAKAGIDKMMGGRAHLNKSPRGCGVGVGVGGWMGW